MRQPATAVQQARERPSDATFAPAILADDLTEVHRVYARLFWALDTTTWDRPVEHGRDEWTLHEAIAHLCALNGAGLESIEHTLRGEPYTFRGLESRYLLNTYNRNGIDEHLGLQPAVLFEEFLRVHGTAADIARDLQPDQADITAVMPIYNRPIRIFEALSIIIMHAGLIHSAQVAEPVGLPPLWTQLSHDVRHRMVGRVMRAFSLLYRKDIGGSLHSVVVFRVAGPGGGEWYVDLSPDAVTSGEARVRAPNLVLGIRENGDFCRMITGRMNLPIALLTGKLRLRGDLRLFLRMSKLFSVDARP